MSDDTTKDLFSRRKFLESGSAAIAAAGMLASDAAAQGEKQLYPSNDEHKPYPTKDDRSSSAPGPGNPEIDAQNPDSFLPPQTDAGGVQAFKYPFGIAHKTHAGRRLVPRSHRPRAPHLKIHRRSRHAPHRWRRPRTPLAHCRRVGHHALRQRPHQGRNRRSALFKNMFLAFRAAGAKDWRSNLVISLNHSGMQHQVEFHYIFPKAVLKGNYTSREADDIANLAFIGGGTNRKISSKSPAAYLASVMEKIGPSGLASQAIPSDERLFDVANYKEFVAKRRHAIADRLNEFILAFSDTDLSSAEPSVENLIAGGENDMVEFKSSLRWDMATDQINKKLEDVVLKSISAFANSDGGVLLIGVDDVGQVLGLAKDYASMDDGGRDKFERHLRQLARDKFGLSYTSTQLACDFCKIDGREICRVTIQPAHEPIVIKVSDKNGLSVERLDIRNGNASQELPVSEMHGYIKKRFALTHSSA